MEFDWKINVGNVLTALALLLGFVAAHIQNVRKLSDIEAKVAMMYDWFTHRIIKGKHDE